MGNMSYEQPEKKTQDIKIVPVQNLDNKKGIIIITDNSFFRRLWFLLSNPFRYIFTGKIRY